LAYLPVGQGLKHYFLSSPEGWQFDFVGVIDGEKGYEIPLVGKIPL
jgi:hypothetical protein